MVVVLFLVLGYWIGLLVAGARPQDAEVLTLLSVALLALAVSAMLAEWWRGRNE